MNSSVCLMVFAVCLAANYGINSCVQAAPSPNFERYLVNHKSNIRAVRQAEPPQPPDGDAPPPPPSGMADQDSSRQKREPKGVGGAMPTRKG